MSSWARRESGESRRAIGCAARVTSKGFLTRAERDETLTYIITEPCINVKDASCVEVSSTR